METQTVGTKAKAFDARNLMALFCLIAILLAACSSLTKSTPQPTAVPVGLSDMISGKVDVGGYELFYKCRGQGSPTGASWKRAARMKRLGPGHGLFWRDHRCLRLRPGQPRQ